MPRRVSALLVVAVLTALAVGAGSAGATIHQIQDWDVSIEGTQTVKWSFAAEKPENCPSYYGTASETAQGAGAISLSFASKKKAPLWAETYFSGNKLRFMSFSTEGWSIPAVFAKRGKFSVTVGMPCGSSPGDPVPLPRVSDDSGCGTEKTTMQMSLYWANGDLDVLGSPDGFYPEGCPGPFELEMWVDSNDPCTPPDKASGIEGNLQELPVALSSREFLKGKAFGVTANHTYRCQFPSTWPGEPPLKVELKTSYEVDFKPRKP